MRVRPGRRAPDDHFGRFADLRKLKDGGIVTARKVGQTVFYSLNAEHLPILRPLLARLTATEPAQ